MDRQDSKINPIDLHRLSQMKEEEIKRIFIVMFYESNISRSTYPIILIKFPKLDYFDIIMSQPILNITLIRELIMLGYPCNAEEENKQDLEKLNLHTASKGVITDYLMGITTKKPSCLVFYENLWQTDLKETLNQMKLLLPQPIFEEVSDNYINFLIELHK